MPAATLSNEVEGISSGLFVAAGTTRRTPGPMVKRKSSLASNEVFRVRILVGLLDVENLTIGRATRMVTGAGWKPVEYV